MKMFLSLMIVSAVYQSANSQSYKKLDVVILINNNLDIYQSNLVLEYQADSTSGTFAAINASYHPGDLSITNEDFMRLMQKNVNTITLKFSYNDNTTKRGKLYTYEIDLMKEWLLETYLIVRVYNLDIKKYKKIYDPIQSDKNYTFEIDSPNNTFRRVSKRPQRTKLTNAK